MFDLAFTRERRREQQGYMTPAQARAFLQMSRKIAVAPGSTPPANPIASAYFRAIEWTTEGEADSGFRALPAGSDASSAEDAADAIDGRGRRAA